MTDIDYNQVVLDKLELGSYDFDFQLDSDYFSQLEHPFVLDGLVHARAHLNLRETDFDLTLAVSGHVTVTCDRCLEPMNIDIDDEEMLDSEEIFNLQSSISNQILDLKWLAYELIVVNLPTVHCHPEGGCNPEMIALLQNHLCRTSEDPEIL